MGVISCLLYNPGVKPMTVKIMGPRGKPTAVLLNDHAVKLQSVYLCVYSQIFVALNLGLRSFFFAVYQCTIVDGSPVSITHHRRSKEHHRRGEKRNVRGSVQGKDIDEMLTSGHDGYYTQNPSSCDYLYKLTPGKIPSQTRVGGGDQWLGERHDSGRLHPWQQSNWWLVATECMSLILGKVLLIVFSYS